VLSATHRPTREHCGSDDTLIDLLLAAEQRGAGALAVHDEVRSLDYAEVAAAARSVAAGLRARGVEAGDRVVVQLPNWWETIVAAWGVFLAGGVLVPVVPIYRERELGFVIEQVRPAAVIAPSTYRGHDHSSTLRRLLAALQPSAALVTVRGDADDADGFSALLETAPEAPAPGANPDDIAVVLYTSGTSADPKGALHSHRTLIAEIRDVTSWCRLEPSRERVFMASPLSHITGLSYGILLPVDLGSPVVLQERWDPAEAVELIERHGCTFTVSATPFLRGLAEAYADRGRSRLRTFVCGGADIPAALVRDAHHAMGTRIVRTYGSTELPTATMGDPFGDLDAAADVDGIPMGGNEVTTRPDENGSPELLVRGPELFLGYLDERLNADAFTPDGYFRTGDLAEITADGAIRITGRIKDVINRGGEKFSAAEVEAALLTHPAVTDVAVVSYPDPVLVERACAFVVAHPELATPSVEELRALVVAAGMAVQKAPEMVISVVALPRTASGKVQRYVLRNQVRGQLTGNPAARAGKGSAGGRP
jgi:cyclohexanecarboxylate-CoA ligase